MIKAIFSINTKGFMGKNNNLIVKDKEDLGNFKKITENHTIVMGRKTWESLGNKPLPNRNNVILSESLESKTILEESGYYTRFVNSGKGVQDILDEDKENNTDNNDKEQKTSSASFMKTGNIGCSVEKKAVIRKNYIYGVLMIIFWGITIPRRESV